MQQTFNRVVVIAPTRSTCVNIHTVLSNGAIPQTLLTQMKGKEIEEAVSRLNEGGFGVVAGTGTGKTVAIRDICRQILGNALTIDVVTREHEATDKTWRSNVLVVTPGVAVNWLKSQKIGREDLIVIDEIHQTSEHLELAMALAKRAGCKFVWMSATIDPATYKTYLGARAVIACDAFDPSRKAQVEVKSMGFKPLIERVQAVLDDMVDEIVAEKRGVAVFVPKREMAEDLAKHFGDSAIHTEFYHGGESAEKLRPFLTGQVPRPFMVFMTLAGASSLNIVGLDTVVIVDQMFKEVVRAGGVKSFEKLDLGANEFLQMGGRVNGRAIGGRIVILSDRDVDFHSLRPTAPQFVLGGDLERVALTCAKIKVDARELDLIGEIDHVAYARVVERFRQRGIIVQNGEVHLTALGERVEKLPVEPHWGEMLVAAEDARDTELFNLVVVVSCIEQLYKLTAREWNRGGVVCVRGSDHLTAYNIVAQALGAFGYLQRNEESGEWGYTFRDDWVRGPVDNRQFGPFPKWCHDNGFMGKEIKNILLAMKSVFRQLQLELPEPRRFTVVREKTPAHEAFLDLLAKVQSLDYVQNERNSVAGTVWGTQGGMASAVRTLGTIRFWNDRKGYRRASIEGTEIPPELVKKYAHGVPSQMVGMTMDGERFRVVYSGTFAGEDVDQFEREFDPDDVPAPFNDYLDGQFAHVLAAQMM